MDPNDPDPTAPDQEALRTESDHVVNALGLNQSLAALGDPIRVGSSALGLMVRNDIDITVVCEALTMTTHESVVSLAAELARHHRVNKVQFRNDTGAWNTDPTYPDGLYLGVNYRSPQGEDWNLDIWFIDDPARQPDLQNLQQMPAQLTRETRAAILAIKQAYAKNPEYGRSITSHDIYRAVLDNGVRTPEEFEQKRL
jgi:hypothetical protein